MVTEAEYNKAKSQYHDLGKKAKGSGDNSKVRKLYETAKRKYKALGNKRRTAKDAKLKAKKIPVDKAKKINKRRKKAAKEADKRTLSSQISTDGRWRRNPEIYDYPGVDTPPK
jgi:hypothetical protein